MICFFSEWDEFERSVAGVKEKKETRLLRGGIDKGKLKKPGEGKRS